MDMAKKMACGNREKQADRCQGEGLSVCNENSEKGD